MLKIVSWNVNGIRACAKKGFSDWLNSSNFDIVCLQEVRANNDQIPLEVLGNSNYQKHWLAGEKKGYSGVGILSKKTPLNVNYGLEIQDIDREGRVLTAEFENCIVVTAYFPNSQDKGARLGFKIQFLDAIHTHIKKLSELKKPVILNGDFNIAHKPIDLARPDDNEDSPGYLPEERAWMESFLNQGWIDSFRYKYPHKKEAYSWWSARTFARERNIGWRIDYNVLHKNFAKHIVDAAIHDKVMGSDHCPVSLTLDL